MSTLTVRVGSLTATASYQVAALRKTPCRGVVDRQNGIRYPGVISSVVIQPNGYDLEPVRGQRTAAVIDSAIAKARADGATGYVLRPQGGLAAPGWLKAITGTITVTDPQGVRPPFTTADVSHPAHVDWCKSVDQWLAGLYDDDPMCREYTWWAHGTEFAEEPTIRQLSDAANRAAYRAAGWSSEVDMAAQLEYLTWFPRESGWHRTPLQVFVQMGYQRLRPDGSMYQDWTHTESILTTARLHNPDAVLGVNNADQRSYVAPDRVYELVGTYGGARRDQTVTWKKFGATDAAAAANLRTCLQTGPNAGVWTQEMPAGYHAINGAELASLDALYQ